jgi:hypothetical protein
MVKRFDGAKCIVIRIVFALLILYAIVGLVRKTLSAPVLGQGGGTRQASSYATSRGISVLETTTFSQHAKTRRRIMSTGISKSPGSRYWRQLYRAALSEIDKSKLPERIAEAERAVVLRARELFQAAGDNGEETEALDAGSKSRNKGNHVAKAL